MNRAGVILNSYVTTYNRQRRQTEKKTSKGMQVDLCNGPDIGQAWPAPTLNRPGSVLQKNKMGFKWAGLMIQPNPTQLNPYHTHHDIY